MRKLFAILVVIVGCLGATTGARAQFCPGVSPWVFDDVLASDPFCGFITKMAQQNVTLGCSIIDANHRLYCPDDSVTRKQMAAFMARLGDALFPLTCTAGQVMKWNGAAWACADDSAGGGGGGGGTVTSVMAGTGLQGSPNPITGAGSLNLAPGYQLPQACSSGQVPKSNGSGGWLCAADAGGAGTVTSVTAAAGGGLATTPGGGIVTAGSVGIAAGGVQSGMLADGAVTNAKIAAGTIAADRLVPIRQLPACVDGQELRRIAGAWACRSLPAAITTVHGTANIVGLFTSIAIGADGFPVVGYYDFTNTDLMVAKCGNPECTGSATITTVHSTGNNVGQFTAVAIGADGIPVVSYYDITTRDLRVAKCAIPACTGAATITTVDSAGDVGRFTSIAIGTDGLPVVSYLDFTNGDLKVAKCGTAACGLAILTPLDVVGPNGGHTSLAIGTDGLPVVSYYDATNGDLKVAKCGNAACTGGATITTVDSSGNVGRDTSLAIGTDGFPVVSYWDFTNRNLKVAKCGNAACTGSATITTVDSTGDVGSFTSLAIGTDGLPVLSYYDATNRDLKIAKCNNAACTGAATITTVDSGGFVGAYTSLAIDTDGFPVVSYFDETNTNLKVLKCTNAACLP